MCDHPQYAMWKARLDAERAAACEREARRARRAVDQEDWKSAWDQYKARWREGWGPGRLPPWWHIGAWLRILFGKSRPYR
jgi:hypothetical protein